MRHCSITELAPLLDEDEDPMQYFPAAATTLLRLGGTSKNEQVKQIRINFYLFKIGSRPSDHYFRSVCLSVCLFVCLSVCLCRVFLSRL